MKLRNKTKLLYCLNLSLVASLFLLLFLNLAQSNSAATEGFVIKNLSIELSKLKNENKELSLKSVDLQSIDILKEKSEKHGMVLASNIDYIVVNSYEGVARR